MTEGLRTFRVIRIDMYADWLDHDADGLIFNLANPSDQPIPNATVVLAHAREKITGALNRIEQAMEADRLAQQTAACA
jgi:hypothetical protein